MKKLHVILLALLIISVPALSQRTTISPEAPRPGDVIEIKYDPSGSDIAGEKSISAVAYLVKDLMPVAHEVVLQKSEDAWTGNIKTEADTKAVFVKYMSGEKTDGNKQVFSLKMTGDDGNPVQGSYAAVGSVLSSMIRLMGADPDIALAYDHLKKELEEFPSSVDNISIYSTYASLAVRNEDGAAVEEVKDKITSLTKKKKAPEEDLLDAARLAGSIRDRTLADEINQRAIESYPEGKAALSALQQKFYSEKDLAAKEALFNEYAGKAGEESQSTLEYMASTLARAYSSDNEAKFNEYFDKIGSKSTKANLLNSVAWGLSGESIEGEGKNLDKAEELSAKSLELLKSAMKDTSGKPEYYTSSEYMKNIKYSYGMYSDTYALILYKNGKFEEALKYQEEFVNNSSYPDPEGNERYCVYLEKVKGKEAAIQAMAKFIQEGNSTVAMKAHFTSALASYTPEEAAQVSLAILETQARAKLKDDMKEKMIDEDAPEFTLRNLKGEEVSLASLKGKTVVLDFWATWCGPCIASFPGMQKAVDKYKDDPSVEILFVDTWENGEKDEKLDKVTKFIDKKGYTFHVVMDLDDKVVASYGVQGIPTKFVIGPDGRMKFRKVGGGAADKLVDELYSMIELVQEDAKLDGALSRLD